MKIIVYVEGRSDKLALETLLESLIEKKLSEGVTIQFSEVGSGDRKVSLVKKIPVKAVNIILNDPTAIVVAMPDLYPQNKGFPHKTVEELQSGIINKFRKHLISKCNKNTEKFEHRFRVFCLKYDLEALILASYDALKDRLGVRELQPTWVTPVEDQNHNNPPKRIVEDLFERCGMRYKSAIDAPVILSSVNYLDIAKACNQCFEPFVEFLAGCQSTID